MPILSLILGALKYAPAIFEAGRDIVQAVTGEEVPPEFSGNPDGLATYVGALTPEQQREIASRILDVKLRHQELDSDRFKILTEGDAEKVRATARPEIALRAMGVIETMVRVFLVLFYAAILEWAARLFWGLLAANDLGIAPPFPVAISLWDIIAKAEPVTSIFLPLVVGAFWASVSVITKYMGCRERDKAREAEMSFGKPLDANAATIEAAGGFVSGAIRAVKGLSR